MDSTPFKRVDDSIREKRRRGKLRSRKSLAEPISSSPARPKTSAKKRKRERESLPQGYYSVQQILEEKRKHGRTLYLIDWEDNTETGESYENTWEPEENVTEAAVADWQRRKSGGNEGNLQSSAHATYSVHESPSENRSKRPAKRARHQRVQLSSPSSNKPRRAGTAETARFQSISQEEHLEVLQEIKDSYEEESSNQASSRLQEQLPPAQPQVQQVQVLVPPIDQLIDRSEYRTYSIQSSRPSQLSQHSQLSLSLSDPDSGPYSSSQSQPNTASQSLSKTPTRPQRPFLWDEDSPAVIPDSQALPGSSSHKSTDTPTSRTETSTRPNTGVSEVTNLESLVQDAQLRSPLIPSESSDTDCRQIVRRSSSPKGAPEEESGISHCESLVTASTVEQELSGALDNLPAIEDSLQNTSQEERANPVDIETATTEHTSNLEDSHSSGPEFSQFQSQLPLPPSSGEVVEEAEVIDSHVTTTQSVSDPIAESESQESGSNQPTQLSRPSVEPIWLDTQVLSPDTDSISRQNHEITILEDLQDSQPRHISRVESTQVPENSALGQVGVNTVTQDENIPSNSGKEQNQIQSIVSNQENSDSIIESIEQREVSSSPIPPRPSPPLAELEDLQDTYETSRFYSAEKPDDMEKHATSSPKNVMEMLREARAKAAADTMAKQAARREAEVREASASASVSASASEVPPTPPPVVNQMLPLRDQTLDLHVPISEPATSPKPSTASSSQSSKCLQVQPLGPKEYAVPLPMVSYIRDIYDTELKSNKSYIESLDANTLDEEEYRGLNLMIDNMKMLCDHNGLITESHATQDNMTDATTTKFAENTSTKCQFLAGFLKKLRPHNKHIAVFVREGRMKMILEAMCRHYEISYSGSEPSFTQGQPKYPFRVTFISTSQAKSDTSINPVSLAIAFDSTYVDNSFTRSVRHLAGTDEVAPLVYLVVTYSAEHLEMCMGNEFDAHERITFLVNGVWQLRKQLGILEPHIYLDGEVAGENVAKYILNSDPDKTWPISVLPDIEGVDLEIESIPVSQAQPSHSGSTTQSHNTSAPSPQNGQNQKRSLVMDDSMESSKRQRLTPNPPWLTTDSAEENLHIADTDVRMSNGGSTTETLISHFAVDGAEEAKEDELSILHQKLATLENEKADLKRKLQDQAQSNEAAEAELKQHNQRLEAQCDDLEKSIQTIQPKYQEALNEQGKAQYDLAETNNTMNTLRQKLEARVLDANKLREEKAVLSADLAAARQALASSEVPDIAEFNKLKEDLATARGEIDRYQKRITNLNSEMEYMRSNYQNASSAAADAQSEISILREDNAVLKRKASSNAREIHAIQASEEIKQHLQRIKGLEAAKTELMKELEKKSEELNALKNGRRSTRGTSVPRSPRMGTMSPGVRERPIARVFGSGVGSRGNSPAPGEASAYRSPFGDALYPDKGPARFGNHLSYER